MPTRRELKNLAKDQLRQGVYWHFVINFVIYAIICGITTWLGEGLTLNFISSIIVLLLIVPLQFGLVFAAIRTTQGKFHICSFMYFISSGFNKYIKTIGLGILLAIITTVGSILFVIPGIIWGLMFGQSIFIMVEKDCGIMEALKESKEIMKGHKWELFVLGWSFILWGLLITFTAGIASVFVFPYIATTFANYYQEVQRDYAKRNGSYNKKNVRFND
ncbi:MAG: DUF975 family protein [Sarcina sp.]